MAEQREVTAVGVAASDENTAISRGRIPESSGDVKPVGFYADFVPSHCTAAKVATGEACQAKPLKGSALCIGHTRRAANG